jgi:hypothetical protein
MLTRGVTLAGSEYFEPPDQGVSPTLKPVPLILIWIRINGRAGIRPEGQRRDQVQVAMTL